MISWTGMAAPAATPRRIIGRLHGAIVDAIAAPDVRGTLEAAGSEARATTPAEMRALVERQLGMWSKVAKDAHIELE